MRCAIAGCLAAMLATALAAQSPQKPVAPQQQPTFKAGVNLVRVDVYPTAKGHAVSDLRQEEFEVREDGVLQRVETFERVVLQPATSEMDRDEPANQEESDEAAGNPRNRLFVLFYDTLHTFGYATPQELAGNGGLPPFPYNPTTVGRALAAFFHKLIGPDDLVGLLTPEMSVTALTFTRRPSSLDDFLLTGGYWQRHAAAQVVDDEERRFIGCGPQLGPVLIATRRLNLTLGALHGLVTHLQNLREGRKVVFVVSEGLNLSVLRIGMTSGFDSRRFQRPPGIGIVKGQPTLRPPDDFLAECQRQLQAMTRRDANQEFRDLLAEANRSNVTFYPIDPRGLTVERINQEWSFTLAAATDGEAIVNLNDPTVALNRVAEEVSSYYLLGYYSTNSKTDGKYRAITVRVKRRGVDVLARRGYYASSEEELAARARAEAPIEPEVAHRNTLLSSLGTERPDRPFRLAAGYGFDATQSDGPRRPLLWVIGELDAAAARTLEWSGGGEATILVTGADGQAVATEHAAITASAPRFSTQLAAPRLKAGDYVVKVRLQGKSVETADESGQLRITLPDVSATTANTLGQPMLCRRGPYTGAGYQPTADLRFRKAERIRVDVPIGATFDSVEARLLDRKGQALPIPVTTGQRDEGGRRFVTAEVVVAPLAPADYLVEVSVRRGEKTEKVLTAFRIVP